MLIDCDVILFRKIDYEVNRKKKKFMGKKYIIFVLSFMMMDVDEWGGVEIFFVNVCILI